jgi:hypothetical protein
MSIKKLKYNTSQYGQVCNALGQGRGLGLIAVTFPSVFIAEGLGVKGGQAK